MSTFLQVTRFRYLFSMFLVKLKRILFVDDSSTLVLRSPRRITVQVRTSSKFIFKATKLFSAQCASVDVVDLYFRYHLNPPFRGFFKGKDKATQLNDSLY